MGRRALQLSNDACGRPSPRAPPVRPRPAPTRPNLQQVLGNQSMRHLLEPQSAGPQWRRDAPADAFESGADRIADRVMRMPAPAPSGACRACDEDGASCPRCAARTNAPVVRRANAAPDSAAGAVPDGVALRPGIGRPLDPAARAFFEPRFGRDFSGVRIHTDTRAAKSARSLGALAYTVGADVVFGAGRYAPATPAGRRLLAHELAHVVQQQTAPTPRLQRRAAIGELPPLNEVDFDAVADQVFAAMDQLGTDEEAVYAGLQQMRRDPVAINYLIQRYAARHHNADLIADIYDEFSEEELEYALQLLGIGHANTPQEIAAQPGATTNLERAAQRLFEAMDRIGTDEEAIYATLLPFNRATQELESTYHFMYSRNLRADIIDEMSGTELDYALSLMSFEPESFLKENFTDVERPMARKILNDILAVQDRLDFSDDHELAVEISKRLRTSQLMQDSQTRGAFGYPESCTQDACPGSCIGHGQPGDPGFVPANINFNAHVNKDARDYWVPSVDAQGFYMFTLSSDGWDDPYQALVKLFTPQNSICDQTLIHCDYLTTVIHMRAFAESIGADEFERRIHRGDVVMVLSYWGFRNIMPPVAPGSPEAGYARTPAGVSLQAVRPSSEADLLIGDHVVFWNHLAYDALTHSPTWSGPWRLENALLVDKDSSGNDLYEGHGAPSDENDIVGPGDKKAVLKDMVVAYNGPAGAAMALARAVDANAPGAADKIHTEFPRVFKGGDGEWWIAEIDDRPENKARARRTYELRKLVDENDPELIGLRDPTDPTKMGWVKRPVESAPGRSPSRTKS